MPSIQQWSTVIEMKELALLAPFNTRTSIRTIQCNRNILVCFIKPYAGDNDYEDQQQYKHDLTFTVFIPLTNTINQS